MYKYFFRLTIILLLIIVSIVSHAQTFGIYNHSNATLYKSLNVIKWVNSNYEHTGQYCAISEKHSDQSVSLHIKGHHYSIIQLFTASYFIFLSWLPNILISGFLILFGILLFSPFFRIKDDIFVVSKSIPRFSEILLISISVSFLTWTLFYNFSEWIWSFNHRLDINQISFTNDMALEKTDGIECYIMYLTMFVNILVVFAGIKLLINIKFNLYVYSISIFILTICSGSYLFKIGFHPPMTSTTNNPISLVLLLPLLITISSIFFYYNYEKIRLWVLIIIILCIVFAGIIDDGPIYDADLMYIIAPALKLLHNSKFSEIYFQYDYYLSFLAYAFIKYNIPLYIFAYLAQFSFFLFFIGSFYFAEKFFKSKGLSVFFITSLILLRYYSIWGTKELIFQVSPLRLDMWLILLLISYKKGVRHWLIGFSIFIFVIFHRNLGILYLAAYFQLLLLLFIVDFISLVQNKEMNAIHIKELLTKHIKINFANLSLCLGSILLCIVFGGGLFSTSALVYTKLGIGMLPISKISFFWYIPILITSSVMLLLFYKHIFTEKYVSLGLFIVFITIANSVYFLGRSHENNILNISGVLVFLLFLFFDLIITLTSETICVKNVPLIISNRATINYKIRITQILPGFFVFLVSFYYSERMYNKISIQSSNLSKLKPIYPLPKIDMDTTSIKKITNNSKNVYFLDFCYDTWFDFYGNYAPQGFFSPQCGYVYKKDLLQLIQELLDKHYFIVYHCKDYIIDESDFMPYKKLYYKYINILDFNTIESKGDWVAISKNNHPYQFNNSTSLLHLTCIDTLPVLGVNRSLLNRLNDFSIELLFKPIADTMNKGYIFNNFTFDNGSRGIFLKKDSTHFSKYIFGVGNGNQSELTIEFPISPNQWHYLVISVNKDDIKVYDNAKLVANSVLLGNIQANSDSLFYIGNNADGNRKFNGEFREIKISNTIVDTLEIIKTYEKIDSMIHFHQL